MSQSASYCRYLTGTSHLGRVAALRSLFFDSLPMGSSSIVFSVEVIA